MSNHKLNACIAAAVLLLGIRLRAATTAASITDVLVLPPNQLQVLLSADAKSGPSGCGVLPSKTAGQLEGLSCKLDVNRNIVVITTQEPVDSTDSYIVVLKGITFDQKPVTLTGQSKPPKPPIKGPPCILSHVRDLFNGSLSSPGSAGSASAMSPDLSFTGQTTHSVGGSFQGTYSVQSDLSSVCAIGRIGPALNLQGGNDPNGSPDSLNFSFKWDAPLGYSFGPFQSIHLIQAGTLESTQDFLQKDIIYSLDVSWRFKPFVRKAGRNTSLVLALFPDTGVEAGKNIRSVIPSADGSGIARPKVGASEFSAVQINKPWLKGVSLNTTWTRRWPLIGEVAFKSNKAGATPEFLPVGVGTGPRDYVKPSFSLDLNSAISFTTSYEYGSLPPKYSKLNSKFTVGLTIKGSFAGSNKN